MEVLDVMEQQLAAAAQNNFVAMIAAISIGIKHKLEKRNLPEIRKVQ